MRQELKGQPSVRLTMDYWTAILVSRPILSLTHGRSVHAVCKRRRLMPTTLTKTSLQTWRCPQVVEHRREVIFCQPQHCCQHNEGGGECFRQALAVDHLRKVVKCTIGDRVVSSGTQAFIICGDFGVACGVNVVHDISHSWAEVLQQHQVAAKDVLPFLFVDCSCCNGKAP